MQTRLAFSAYRRLLEPWIPAASAYFYHPPDRPDLLVYGTGYNGWGVQTHQKAFAALAVLAADPELDIARTGVSREALVGQALAMLRFSLESHIVGGYHGMDGVPWGHTWISALGLERMMHGAEALAPYLTERDAALLRSMLISESDWLLDSYPVEAGPIQHNKPESNIWNGAIMHRTAMMYPDAPRAAEYREKGTAFLVNGISIAADATSAQLYDGKPVSSWFVGDNFFPSFSLNHHGYLNVGYMVICLSNIAMLHFAYRTRGLQAPAALYHHAEELWGLVKACTFPDGRLLRIGGDTRVRYCYCQDYAIPMWLLASEQFGDPHAAAFEAEWLQQVEREITDNGDGAYLSGRCAELAVASPLYYTRLEADRAATLSMGAYWRRLLEIPAVITPSPPIQFAWQDDYHGAVYHRSANRMASWVWRAAELPQGLCLPADGSNLAEWRENLAGCIHGQGRYNGREVIRHEERSFAGGFLTWGRVDLHSQKMLGEGQQDDVPAALQQLVIAALPDDTTMLALQYAVAPARRIYLTRVAGINLLVPNDLFNDYRRTYYTEHGALEIPGLGSIEEVIATDSRWLNVDNRLGVIGGYGMEQLSLHRPGKRQIGLKTYPTRDPFEAGGMLYADEIVAPWQDGLRSYDPGAALFDVGFAVQANASRETTARCAASCSAVAHDCPDVRALRAEGVDDRTYLLLANFGEMDALPALELPIGTRLTDLVTNEQFTVPAALSLAATSARLFRVG